MNIFSKCYCRCYQFCFKIGMKLMNFRQPELIDGLGRLANKVQEEGYTSILIVTDDFLHNKGKLIDPLKADFDEKGIKYAVYDKTVPNPTIQNIEEAYQMYNKIGANAIVAFGGGSPMDCAKGVGIRVARPDKTIPQMKGTLKVRKAIPTIFAVPTTSGTGSEATVAAVISNPETHEKYPINDPVLIPKYAVLDPSLTLGLPPHITSTTGMDALTHAVEAYIGKSTTAQTRDWSIKATKLIFENLEDVYNDGSDLKKRKKMQEASYLAGMSFTRSYVGYVHAIAHALGGQYGVPHGLANAVILPHVLDYFGKSAWVKLAELANAVGIQGTVEQQAKEFIRRIKEMNERMNIPTTIDKIREEDIPTMVEHSLKEANPLYPVPKFMGKKEMTDMYYEIMGKTSVAKEEPVVEDKQESKAE